MMPREAQKEISRIKVQPRKTTHGPYGRGEERGGEGRAEEGGEPHFFASLTGRGGGKNAIGFLGVDQGTVNDLGGGHNKTAFFLEGTPLDGGKQCRLWHFFRRGNGPHQRTLPQVFKYLATPISSTWCPPTPYRYDRRYSI